MRNIYRIVQIWEPLLRMCSFIICLSLKGHFYGWYNKSEIIKWFTYHLILNLHNNLRTQKIITELSFSPTRCWQHWHQRISKYKKSCCNLKVTTSEIWSGSLLSVNPILYHSGTETLLVSLRLLKPLKSYKLKKSIGVFISLTLKILLITNCFNFWVVEHVIHTPVTARSNHIGGNIFAAWFFCLWC